jgi:hypothetical protein
MVIYRPHHAQLRHPLLRCADISDAAQALTAWEVHKKSFLDLLRLVAEHQMHRFPERIIAYPPETASRPISQVAYGFQLLLVRGSDLALMVPELAGYPFLSYPYREVSSGRTGRLLIVDGWTAEPQGLLATLPSVRVTLDGSLDRVQEAAFMVFHKLQIILDAVLRIPEMQGSERGRLEHEGWTAIPYLRKGSGRLLAGQSTRQRFEMGDFLGGEGL